MAGTPPRLVIRTEIDPRGFWITVPLQLPDGARLRLVLDSGSPLSSLSSSAMQQMQDRGFLKSAGSGRYVLTGLATDGLPFPELTVRLSRRVTQVGADGVLGLDFLGRFEDVHFHVPTMTLLLSR